MDSWGVKVSNRYKSNYPITILDYINQDASVINDKFFAVPSANNALTFTTDLNESASAGYEDAYGYKFTFAVSVPKDKPAGIYRQHVRFEAVADDFSCVHY